MNLVGDRRKARGAVPSEHREVLIDAHGEWWSMCCELLSCSGSALSLLNKARWAVSFSATEGPWGSSVKEHMCVMVKHMDGLRFLCAWFAAVCVLCTSGCDFGAWLTSLHSAQLGVTSGRAFLTKSVSVLHNGDALIPGTYTVILSSVLQCIAHFLQSLFIM